MTDRDLMIAVAKAIGGTLSEGHTQRRSLSTAGGWEWIGAPGVVTPDDWRPYPGVVIHPLHDDGDCAQLEASACINVQWSAGGVYACNFDNGDVVEFEDYADHGFDKGAARRRATVRAAALLSIPSQEVQP